MPATRQSSNRLTGTRQVIPVKWKSRCVGFLSGSSVEYIIAQASAHFRLRAVVDELVLIGTIDGVEMELTNETLELVPKGETVVLWRIRADSDGDHADVAAERPIVQSSSGGSHSGEIANAEPEMRGISATEGTKPKEQRARVKPDRVPWMNPPFREDGKTFVPFVASFKWEERV